jgi:hypothetical protein
MRAKLAAVAVATVTALTLAGCIEGTGTVVDIRPCKTSTCIYVEQDSNGKIGYEMGGASSFGSCSVGDRWPACKEGDG